MASPHPLQNVCGLPGPQVGKGLPQNLLYARGQGGTTDQLLAKHTLSRLVKARYATLHNHPFRQKVHTIH